MLVRESPVLYFEGKSKDPDQVIEEFSSSFFHFRVELPTFVLAVHEEMLDDDLLLAAEATGTFRFMDNEGENDYRP